MTPSDWKDPQQRRLGWPDAALFVGLVASYLALAIGAVLVSIKTIWGAI